MPCYCVAIAGEGCLESPYRYEALHDLYTRAMLRLQPVLGTPCFYAPSVADLKPSFPRLELSQACCSLPWSNSALQPQSKKAPPGSGSYPVLGYGKDLLRACSTANVLLCATGNPDDRPRTSEICLVPYFCADVVPNFGSCPYTLLVVDVKYCDGETTTSDCARRAARMPLIQTGHRIADSTSTPTS